MAQFEIRDLTPAFGSEVVGFEPVELDSGGPRRAASGLRRAGTPGLS